jgi:hypothetical protein
MTNTYDRFNWRTIDTLKVPNVVKYIEESSFIEYTNKSGILTKGILVDGKYGSNIILGHFDPDEGSYLGIYKAGYTYKLSVTIENYDINTTTSLPLNIGITFYMSLAEEKAPNLTRLNALSGGSVIQKFGLSITTLDFTTATVNTTSIGKPIIIKIFNKAPNVTNAQQMNLPFIITNISFIETPMSLEVIPTTTPTPLILPDISKNSNFSSIISNTLPTPDIIYWQTIYSSLISYNNSSGELTKGVLVNGSYNSGIMQGHIYSTNSSYIGVYKAGYSYTINCTIEDYNLNTSSSLPFNVMIGLFTGNSITGTIINISDVISINALQAGYNTKIYNINASSTSDVIGKPIIIKIYQNKPIVTNNTQSNRPFIIKNIQILEIPIQENTISTSTSTSSTIPSALILTNTNTFQKFVNVNYLDVVNPNLANVPLLIDYSYAGYRHSEEEITIKNKTLFNVLDYGADKTGVNYSIVAIQAAVDAAKLNGGGVIYFPKGTYKVNDTDDGANIIKIKSSNIVFQGEDMNNTIIYLDKPTIDACATPSISFEGSSICTPKYNIIRDEPRGSSFIKLDSVEFFKIGDTIAISSPENDGKNPSKYTEYYNKMMETYYGGLTLLKAWANYKDINQMYEIESIDKINNIIKIKGVLHIYIFANLFTACRRFALLDNCGVENITFRGRGDYISWDNKPINFVHHYGTTKDVINNEPNEKRRAQLNSLHDCGWQPLSFGYTQNMFVRNVIVENTGGIGGFSSTTRNGTFENIIFQGKKGHSSINIQGTNNLCKNVLMKVGNQHGPGFTKNANGCVLKNITLYNNQTTDFHGKNPFSNLLDNVRAGRMTGHGGSADVHPAHGRWLTMWNFYHQNDKQFSYDFWDMFYSGSNAIIKPILVGFGNKIITSTETKPVITSVKFVEYEEKMNEAGNIYPESLFDAQLKLRLYIKNKQL